MRTYKCNENTETKQKFLLAICLSTYLRFNHPAYNLKLKDCKDFCFYKFLFYVGKLLYLKSIQNKFEVIMWNNIFKWYPFSNQLECLDVDK